MHALGRGYRGVAADLALARRSFPGDPLVGRLESLATRSRALLYERQTRRRSLLEFYTAGYWQLLRERGRFVVLATTGLLLPALLAGLWGWSSPEAAVEVVPDGFLWVTEAESTDQGLSPTQLAAFSTQVMVNNIQVTLVAFALGITWGIGTLYVLLSNGLILGAVTGLAIEAGNGSTLLAAIAAHGVLELSCIVIGAAAGLSLGWSLIRPGRLSRTDSLRQEAAATIRIAAGTAPWLILAGVIEGFVSRVGLEAGPTLVVGLLIGVDLLEPLLVAEHHAVRIMGRV